MKSVLNKSSLHLIILVFLSSLLSGCCWINSQQRIISQLEEKWGESFPSVQEYQVNEIYFPDLSFQINNSLLSEITSRLLINTKIPFFKNTEENYLRIDEILNISTTNDNAVIISAKGMIHSEILFAKLNITVNEITVYFQPRINNIDDNSQMNIFGFMTYLDIEDVSPKLEKAIANLATVNMAPLLSIDLKDDINMQLDHPDGNGRFNTPFEHASFIVDPTTLTIQFSTKNILSDPSHGEWHPATRRAQWNGGVYPKVSVYKKFLWGIGGGKRYSNYSPNGSIWKSRNGKTWDLVLEKAPWDPAFISYTLPFKGKLLAFGGHQIGVSGPLDNVWRSEDGINWKMAGKCPPRSGASIVVFDDKIWMVGGGYLKDKYIWTDDIYASENGIDWTLVTTNPGFGNRAGGCLVNFKNELWFFGGRDASTNPISYDNAIWKSSNGRDWNKTDSILPWDVNQTTIRCDVQDGRLWVDKQKYEAESVLWYTENGKDWERFNVPYPWPTRYGMQFVIFNDSLFLMGGFSGDPLSAKSHNDVWYITP